MADQSLKGKAFRGVIWNAVENFALKGGQFVIGVILARLLSPKDYGLLGMLAIFIAISQTFIDSGMGNALIQKKNRTDADYSTVFVFNFIVSLSLYLILFFTAPFIADFYHTPQLVMLTRVVGLEIVIISLSLVQNTKLNINLDFRTKAKVSTVTVIFSGMVAITLAYFGFGVWALVFQTLSRAISNCIMLWFFSRWRPSLRFSKESFDNLFHFGAKLLTASLIATFFQYIYNIIIGRNFSARQLGYYTQGMNIAELTSGTLSGIVQTVTFPILASIQDDKERMIAVYKRLIGMTTFIVFPTMTLLALLAKPFVLFFLTEKWASTIILLQLLCFARIIKPISALNMNILNAIGRSDLFLKVDLSKIPISVIALVVTIPFGVKAMVIGQVVVSFIAFFINAYLPGKYFGYGAGSQIKDMRKVLIAVAFMVLCVYGSLRILPGNGVQFFAGGIIGAASYLLASFALKIEETGEVVHLIKMVINK